MKKIWTWLNGKKTVIGGALFLAGKVATLLGQPAVGEVLEIAGGVIGGVGVGHKGVKSYQKRRNG